MTAIFSLEKWIEITSRGTSGDQVSDILASWEKDRFELREKIGNPENTSAASTFLILLLTSGMITEVSMSETPGTGGDYVCTIRGEKLGTAYGKFMNRNAALNNALCQVQTILQAQKEEAQKTLDTIAALTGEK